jgi:hypothetical protein
MNPHFDDFETSVLSMALLRAMQDRDWVEQVAVEHDTGDEFWETLQRKCARAVDQVS